MDSKYKRKTDGVWEPVCDSDEGEEYWPKGLVAENAQECGLSSDAKDMPGSDEQVSLETTLLRPELVQALTNLNIVGLNKRQKSYFGLALEGQSFLFQASGENYSVLCALAGLQNVVAENSHVQTVYISDRRQAEQVAELLKHMAAGMEGVRVESCVGGLSTKKARHGPMQVAVGSSSKLLQMLQSGAIMLASSPVIIVDQCETVLATGGRLQEIREILGLAPVETQVLLVSATLLPQAELKICEELLSKAGRASQGLAGGNHNGRMLMPFNNRPAAGVSLMSSTTAAAATTGADESRYDGGESLRAVPANDLQRCKNAPAKALGDVQVDLEGAGIADPGRTVFCGPLSLSSVPHPRLAAAESLPEFQGGASQSVTATPQKMLRAAVASGSDGSGTLALADTSHPPSSLKVDSAVSPTPAGASPGLAAFLVGHFSATGEGASAAAAAAGAFGSPFDGAEFLVGPEEDLEQPPSEPARRPFGELTNMQNWAAEDGVLPLGLELERRQLAPQAAAKEGGRSARSEPPQNVVSAVYDYKQQGFNPAACANMGPGPLNPTNPISELSAADDSGALLAPYVSPRVLALGLAREPGSATSLARLAALVGTPRSAPSLAAGLNRRQPLAGDAREDACLLQPSLLAARIDPSLDADLADSDDELEADEDDDSDAASDSAEDDEDDYEDGVVMGDSFSEAGDDAYVFASGSFTNVKLEVGEARSVIRHRVRPHVPTLPVRTGTVTRLSAMFNAVAGDAAGGDDAGGGGDDDGADGGNADADGGDEADGGHGDEVDGGGADARAAARRQVAAAAAQRVRAAAAFGSADVVIPFGDFVAAPAALPAAAVALPMGAPLDVPLSEVDPSVDMGVLLGLEDLSSLEELPNLF